MDHAALMLEVQDPKSLKLENGKVYCRRWQISDIGADRAEQPAPAKSTSNHRSRITCKPG
jgi:hypothetical protein